MSACRSDPASGIVVFQQPGRLDYAAWEAAVREALAQPRSGGRRRFLSDRRKSSPMTLELVEGIIDFLRGNATDLEEAQWAVLAEDESEVYAILTVGARLAQSTRVRVKAFIELREALRWLLGVEEPGEIDRLTEWIDREE